MNTFEEELDKILAPFDDIAYRPNFKDFEDAKTAIKAATLRRLVEELDPKLSETSEEYTNREWYNTAIQDMKDNLGETK
jgi:hypothetical protein